MTKIWVVEGTEGWWQSFGWKEIERCLVDQVSMVHLEHEVDIDLNDMEE